MTCRLKQDIENESDKQNVYYICHKSSAARANDSMCNCQYKCVGIKHAPKELGFVQHARKISIEF